MKETRNSYKKLKYMNLHKWIFHKCAFLCIKPIDPIFNIEYRGYDFVIEKYPNYENYAIDVYE